MQLEVVAAVSTLVVRGGVGGPSPDEARPEAAGPVGARAGDGADGGLAGFHPAVAAWFSRTFPDGPTPAQAEAWPLIAAGLDTLVAAPTGSGKTLSAFLVAIDQLYRAHERGLDVTRATHVIYASPLRALATDIRENLEGPLGGIAAEARRLGLDPPELTVGVRTGDTTPAGRAALLRRPPTFLVTTPESLYLLLTSERGRGLLATASTVIVDEIHALARDKRGSHLALSLERLDRVVAGAPEPGGGGLRRPVRIGLSATQRPVELVARFLVGAGRPCRVVDHGHRRQLDLALELPDGELEAVMSGQQMSEVVDRIAELVAGHRTTLVFTNTRRLAERLAHQLGERLGDDVVCAHHGSLSKERRQRVEARLRAGELKALVATASLELGIDIGPVDLVCQIGSARSLATFLQRVGRSGHTRWGTPKGRLFPLSRDELVESAATLAGVRAGRLDALHPPEVPLDILAQQLVAEVAATDEARSVDELFALVRRAEPYARLERADFDQVLGFVSDGIATGRGRRAAYLHHDRVNGEVRARRGARLAALTSGGAIPEVADFRVVADPDETFVGTVNEDWAVESMAGDVFLLGTHAWRIRRVEAGVVRVVDAEGAAPTIPFWLGESPGRTTELSEEVSRLRAVVDTHLAAGDPDGARAWLARTCGIEADAAELIVAYLAAARAALGLVPTRQELVVERFFDDTGGMQLVVHSPYGACINRAFGLALRKRFCVTFDFELQAAANDDALVLSLGPQHSFPLDDVGRFLRADTVAEVLQHAVLVPPFAMFTSRWRWNLNRSLTVLRWKGGRRNPPALQRMESDDVMAALFPSVAACQENATGPLEVPDHPVVRQTLHDTMTEALDLGGLQALLVDIEAGRVTLHTRDTTEPSPLCHELVSGRPYTYLDDAPLEERRTRAVNLRRGLPVDPSEIGRVDAVAVARLRAEVRPEPGSPDELCDLLASLVLCRAREPWRPWFEALAARRRAVAVEHRGARWWAAAERAGAARALLGLPPEPTGAIEPGEEATDPAEVEAAAVAAVEGRLEISGPVTVAELAEDSGLAPSTVLIALHALEGRGAAIRGRFEEPWVDGDEQWCARRLLQRIHVSSQKRRRQQVEPVTIQDFVRFLHRWHHVAPGTQRRGPDGVLEAIAQLQGWEAPAGSWEQSLLAARVERYRPSLLDQRCHAGDVTWARLTLPGGSDGSDTEGEDDGEGEGGGRAGPARSPSRATPISLCARADLAWLLAAVRRADSRPTEPVVGALAEILALLRTQGARFHRELAADTGRLASDIERALWDGVARGLLTADGFHAVRSLLDSRQAAALHAEESPLRRRRSLRRGASAAGRAPGEGRWALVANPACVDEPDELAEAVAEQLLARWGVAFRELALREHLSVPWREVQWAFRRLEARGVIRGGRFVLGCSGEQYASPEAVELLRRVRRLPRNGERVVVSAADPLNLTGILLPGRRVPALGNRTVAWCDGLPVDIEGVPDDEPGREPLSAGAAG